MKNLLMDIGKGLLNLFDVSKILKEKLDSAKPGTKRAVAAIIVICLVVRPPVCGFWYSYPLSRHHFGDNSEQSLTLQVGGYSSSGRYGALFEQHPGRRSLLVLQQRRGGHRLTLKAL